MGEQIYKFKGETIFPLHIGSGEEWDALQYVIDGDYLYHYDISRIITKLKSSQQVKLMNIIENANAQSMLQLRQEIYNLFENDSELLKYCLFKCKVTDEIKIDYQKNVNSIVNQLLIKPFIRSNDKLYIPGSSIKGAIRTAVFQSWIDEEYNNLNYILGDIEKTDANKTFQMQIINNKLQSEVGRYTNAKNEAFRCIKVKDVVLDNVISTIVKTSKKKLRPNDKSWDEVVECIPPGTKFTVELSINHDLLAKSIRNENPSKRFWFGRKIGIEEISNSCYNFYFDQIENEIGKFNHLSDKNIDTINNIDDNSTLIRVGRYSHVESVTFTSNPDKERHECEEIRKPKVPKGKKFGTTRTLANLSNGEKVPFGLLKLTLE